MRCALWFVLASTGCGFRIASAPDDGGNPDGSGATDACTTFSSQLDTCAHVGGSSLILDGEYALDTDTGVLTRAGGGAPAVVTGLATTTTNLLELRVLAVDALTLRTGARLRGTGSRGLAIVATGAIQLEGTAMIDVSVGGSGARVACAGGAVTGEDDGGGAAGGGGGGFGAAGGRGGNGNSDGGQSAGGAGGLQSVAPAGPLGGCPGATGGDGADPGGAGGLAGGAVYLASAVAIGLSPAAVIDACGGGGAGGARSNSSSGDAGGGGGGAGGMILLEAPRVRTGILVANGGGGGEGSGNGNAGRAGTSGGTTTAFAPGGNGGSPTGTDGGPGGAAATANGGTPANVLAGGGGGGGGAVGVIRVVSPDLLLGTSSPAPTP